MKKTNIYLTILCLIMGFGMTRLAYQTTNDSVAITAAILGSLFLFVGIGLLTEMKEKSLKIVMHGTWNEDRSFPGEIHYSPSLHLVNQPKCIKEPTFKGRKGQGICIHCGLESQPLHLCKCHERNYKEGTWKSKVTAEEKRMKKVIIGVDFVKVDKNVSKKK